MATFWDLKRQANEKRRKLVEFSELDPSLVENVLQYAKCLVKPTTTFIDENIFRAQMVEHFDITSHFMLTKMFQVLKKRNKKHLATLNKGNEENIPLEDYCKLICVFMSNNLDLKIEWVFSVYDLNNDGALSKLEVFLLMKPCMLPMDDMTFEEAEKDLMDIVVTVVDFDEHGLMDLERFRAMVKGNTLYFDLLGKALPHDTAVEKFVCKIQNKSTLQVAALFQNERARSLSEPSLSKVPSLYPIALDLP